MSVIKNLFMPRVESYYPAHNLIEAFHLNRIATVSEVIYEPYMADDCLYYRAYIEVYKWHNTKEAYDFIDSIEDYNVVTVINCDGNLFNIDIDDTDAISYLKDFHRTINFISEEEEEEEPWMKEDEEEDERARQEYEDWIAEQDFIQEAEYYHEEIMEERIKNRKIMTPHQFRVWDVTSGFGKTKKECQYEIYLKTGATFY